MVVKQKASLWQRGKAKMFYRKCSRHWPGFCPACSQQTSCSLGVRCRAPRNVNKDSKNSAVKKIHSSNFTCLLIEDFDLFTKLTVLVHGEPRQTRSTGCAVPFLSLTKESLIANVPWKAMTSCGAHWIRRTKEDGGIVVMKKTTNNPFKLRSHTGSCNFGWILAHHLIKLFGNTAAILSSIVLNDYDGKLRVHIGMYFAPQYPIIATWKTRIQNGRRIAEKAR